MKESITDTLRVFVVPVQILEDESLTSQEKLIYIVLRSFVNAYKSEAFPSHKRISRLSGLGVTTIKKYLDSLVEKGYISREVRWDFNKTTNKFRQTSNLYKLDLPALENLNNDAKIPLPQSPDDYHPSRQTTTPQSPDDYQDHNHLTYQEGIKTCNVMSDPVDRNFIFNLLSSKAEKMIVNEHLEFIDCIEDITSGLLRRRRIDRQLIADTCDVWIQRQFDNHAKHNSYIEIKRAAAFFMNCYDEAAAAKKRDPSPARE